MKTGLHKHHCPIHSADWECHLLYGCTMTHFTICFEAHDRPLLESYLEKLRKEQNAEIREIERDARDSYSQGKFDGISKSQDFR